MGVPVINGRTQILTDAAVEMIHKGIAQACAVGQRSNIAVLVSPLVHSESVNITGGDVKLVEHVGNGGVSAGPLVGADHGERLILQVGHQNAVEHILHHVQSGVDNNLNRETVLVGVLHVLAFDVTDTLQFLQRQLAVGQPGCGFKAEFIVQTHNTNFLSCFEFNYPEGSG